MNALSLIILVSLIQSPQFDMQGTIIRVNSPSSMVIGLSLIHISEPTRLLSISYAVFCLKKKKKNKQVKTE